MRTWRTEVEQTPGVKAAVPSVLKLSSLRYRGSKVGLWAMGIDPARDKAVRDYELEEGAFFQKKYEALLETGFARGLGVGVGDEIKLGTTRGGLSGSLKPFKIVGLLSPRGAAGFKQGGIVFLPLETAEYLFSKTGNVNTISVVVADAADEHAVAEALRARSAQRADRPLADGAIPTLQGDRREGPEGVGLRLRDDPGAGVFHDPQHVPDERGRAAAAVGRAAGDRRHPPADHPHAVAGRTLAWASWERPSASRPESAGRCLLTQSMGQVYSTRHARPADYRRPVYLRRLSWPERLAAGHVCSGVDRGPGLAAGRNAVHRLRRAAAACRWPTFSRRPRSLSSPARP